jgi:hypothetical protein
MSKKIVIKTTARTLIYQTLIGFTIIVAIFLQNPIYWGLKVPILEKSARHIFYPVKYSEKVEAFVKRIGKTRLFFEVCQDQNRVPDLFEVIKDSERVINEQWYVCEYQYVNEEGFLDIHEYRTRIDWKPWEFDYMTEEEYYDGYNSD